MTEPLDSSSDTEKMSEDSGDQPLSLVSSEDKPLIIRYDEARSAYLQTKSNIKKLKGIEDNISKNRFDGILADYQAELEKVQPEKEALEEQIKQQIGQLTGELNQTDAEVATISAQIEELTQLYKTGIIEKNQYTQDVAPLAQKKKELDSTRYAKEAENQKLTHALRPVDDDVPMLISGFAPAAIKAPSTMEPVSYFQKFAIFFLVIGCVLPPLSWLLFLGMEQFGMADIIPSLHSVIQIFVFLVAIGYLFRGTRARFISYFITAIFFFLFSILCTAKFGTIDLNATAYFDIMKKAMCLWTIEKPLSLGVYNYCGAMNFTIALIVFIIASLRNFFIGLQYEYNNN